MRNEEFEEMSLRFSQDLRVLYKTELLLQTQIDIIDM